MMKIAGLVLSSSLTIAVMAQTVAVPPKRPVAVQSVAAAAEIQDVLFRSMRLACVGNDFASFHLVTSRETYNVVYACFPYSCATDTRTCRTGCSDNSQCSGGTVCDKGHCVIPTPHCSDDGLLSVSPLGTDKCSPYACNRSTGACQRDCRTTEDCAGGFVCDINPHVCVHP